MYFLCILFVGIRDRALLSTKTHFNLPTLVIYFFFLFFIPFFFFDAFFFFPFSFFWEDVIFVPSRVDIALDQESVSTIKFILLSNHLMILTDSTIYLVIKPLLPTIAIQLSLDCVRSEEQFSFGAHLFIKSLNDYCTSQFIFLSNHCFPHTQ